MNEPASTDYGRYVVINGRRWRATDPAIPEERRAELTRILMAWRREVRRTKGTAGEAAARAGVQAAKVALGERAHRRGGNRRMRSGGRGGRPTSVSRDGSA